MKHPYELYFDMFPSSYIFVIFELIPEIQLLLIFIHINLLKILFLLKMNHFDLGSFIFLDSVIL